MWVQPVYAICCGLSITQTLNVVLVSVQNLKVCRFAQNSALIFGCSRFVPCPVVQFGQFTQRFCVLPVLAGRLFAMGNGFQKFFGCRRKIHVFCSFLLQKLSASAIIIDRNRDCALGCAASVLWWNRSSVLLWSVGLTAYFLCHKG
nr:MAG TPA: hypothetical protein [Caudoviricetes sp.]